MLMSEIYKAYPYVLDEGYIVTPDMLTNCVNRVVGRQM